MLFILSKFTILKLYEFLSMYSIKDSLFLSWACFTVSINKFCSVYIFLLLNLPKCIKIFIKCHKKIKLASYPLLQVVPYFLDMKTVNKNCSICSKYRFQNEHAIDFKKVLNCWQNPM